jgi:hypothetical protein
MTVEISQSSPAGLKAEDCVRLHVTVSARAAVKTRPQIFDAGQVTCKQFFRFDIYYRSRCANIERLRSGEIRLQSQTTGACSVARIDVVPSAPGAGPLLFRRLSGDHLFTPSVPVSALIRIMSYICFFKSSM